MKKLYFILIGCCLTFIACEDALVKTLDLEDFAYEKQMAISGALNSEADKFKLLISENQAITDPFDQWEAAVDATATLFYGSTVIGSPMLEINNPDGGPDNLFSLDLENIDLDPGTYRLEVEHPTLGSAFAETEIPKDIQLDKIEFLEDYGIAPNFLERSDAVVITFNDPPEDNYYSLRFELDMIMYDTFIYNTDTIVYQENPYLGVDSGEQGAQLLRDGILFNDSFFNGKEHTIVMYLTGLEFQEDKEEFLSNLKITWDVISRDKFEFDSSLELYNNSQGFGPFTEAVTIYNNIEGGAGIFSGLNRSFYPIP